MILFAVFSNSVCGVIRGCCVGNWCDPFCKEKFSEIRAFLKLQAQASACRWLTHTFTLKKIFLGCNGNEVVQELCNFLLVCDVLYFVIYLWEVKSDYGGTSRVSFWLTMGKNLNFSFQLHPFVNQVFAQAWWWEIFYYSQTIIFSVKMEKPLLLFERVAFFDYWIYDILSEFLSWLHVLLLQGSFTLPGSYPWCAAAALWRWGSALWQGKPFCWRGEGLAREGLSSFALEEGTLSHLSQKERIFRCLLPETDLLSVLFRRRIKMFATRHPLLPLLSPPTPCCGNGPGCVVFSPAFLGLLFGLMVLEMLCKQLRLCFILSCCLWFISVSRTALQFDHVEYRAVLRVLRAFAAVVRRCWRSTCARQVALVVRAVYFPGSSVGYQRCRHVGA